MRRRPPPRLVGDGVRDGGWRTADAVRAMVASSDLGTFRDAPRNSLAYRRAVAISEGSKISWNTSQGPTHGRTVEKRTTEFTFDGQTFNASDDEPYWIVKSDKTGATAAHRESSLTAR